MQVGTYPTRNFALDAPHIAMRLGPSLHLLVREVAGVWPLRIPAHALPKAQSPATTSALAVLSECSSKKRDDRLRQLRQPGGARAPQSVLMAVASTVTVDVSTPAVDEADDPLSVHWPFLLIVRTGQIVTGHHSHPTDGRDSSRVPPDSTGFPANSQLHYL